MKRASQGWGYTISPWGKGPKGVYYLLCLRCKTQYDADRGTLILRSSILLRTRRLSCCSQQHFVPLSSLCHAGFPRSCPLQHRLDGLSGMRVLNRLLVVLEVVGLDKFFHGKLALGVGLDQKGDKLLGSEVLPATKHSWNNCTSAGDSLQTANYRPHNTQRTPSHTSNAPSHPH